MSNEQIKQFAADYAEVVMVSEVLKSYSTLFKYEPLKILLSDTLENLNKMDKEIYNQLFNATK